MLIPFFYTLNILLLLTGLWSVRLESGERKFSLTLIQTLLGLPLIAGEYFYLTSHLDIQTIQLILFSEVIFSLIWLTMALRLRRATLTATEKSRLNVLVEMLTGILVTLIAGYFLSGKSGIIFTGNVPVFKMYSPVYFSTFFLLIVVLYVSWRLEQFWNGLKTAQRWEYKYLLIGNLLVCGTFAWVASYRLTYMTIVSRHLLLTAILLFFGWALTLYAVLHHRLLNRKIFVSRKVVYSFAIPSLLAVYLLTFGVISLLMRTFGLEMAFIVQWLLIISGVVAAVTLSFSGKIRSRIQFYISTNFYVNKYEYRDEWLALSRQLQGALTEAEVVKALRRVLADSLYTTQIFIWLGETGKGYRLVSSPGNSREQEKKNTLTADTPLIDYIQSHSHFYLKEKNSDPAWNKVKESTESLLTASDLKLITPIAVGNQLVGLIGLGPEYTGGKYGHDDFDLLTVLGCQTASALLAVRNAEKLAHAREQQAWNRLSAFVLHDIKNAATMLSMVQENAPENIHDPEFQQDMLELVDDVLRRMGRVEQRLLTLKDEITPTLQDVELCTVIQTCCRRLKTKLPGMEVKVDCNGVIQVRTDPELLFSILENLLLNAFQSRPEGNIVQIHIHKNPGDQQAQINITDNGPGIAEELLPDALFEPFTTQKKGGSGIGLWQVQRVVTSMGGTISAANSPAEGARFIIRLPLA
jgi:putative PEP-CTERM system histidine kinase